MARTGRPKLLINQDLFEDLCAIQCTRTEITGVLRVSEPTLRRWVHKTYGGRTFDAVHAEKAEAGKQSLRRAQIKAAMKGNPAMLIWLGKQYLAQRDKQDVDVRVTDYREALATAVAGIVATGVDEQTAIEMLRADPQVAQIVEQGLASEKVQ